jgi:hypothetical protein
MGIAEHAESGHLPLHDVPCHHESAGSSAVQAWPEIVAADSGQEQSFAWFGVALACKRHIEAPLTRKNQGRQKFQQTCQMNLSLVGPVMIDNKPWCSANSCPRFTRIFTQNPCSLCCLVSAVFALADQSLKALLPHRRNQFLNHMYPSATANPSHSSVSLKKILSSSCAKRLISAEVIVSRL